MKMFARLVGFVLVLGLLVACGEKSTPMVSMPGPEDMVAEAEIPDEQSEPVATEEPTEVPVPTDTLEPTPTLPPSQGTVIDLINEVVAHPLPGGDWETAVLDMALYEGGEIWAKEASTALVELGIERLRVAPNTIFTLSRPDDETTVLNLQDGQVWINIEGMSPGESFQVETSTAVASVEGTRFSVRISDLDQTIVSSQVHTVTVTTSAGMASVGEGFQTTVQEDGQLSDPEPMSTEESLLWNMASGPGLDVDVPLVKVPHSGSVSGETGEPSISSDGNRVTFYAYDPSIWTGSFSAFYGLDPSGVFTTSYNTSIHEVDFNPAGNGMAYIQKSKICTSAEDGSNASCFDDSGDYSWPTWSPDGSQLVYGMGDSLMVSNPDGSDATLITESGSGENKRATWSPDGNQIAYVNTPFFNAPGDVWTVNTDGSDRRQVFTGIQWSYFAPLAWSPDGAWFALARDDGLWLVSADGASSQLIPGTGPWEYHDVTWSPTSTGWPLFFGYTDPASGTQGTMYITSMGSEPKSFPNATWGPVWSGDGRRGAFGYVILENGQYQSMIYVIQVEPALWP